ncbi:unnamed protein product [Lampetra planeri]
MGSSNSTPTTEDDEDSLDDNSSFSTELFGGKNVFYTGENKKISLVMDNIEDQTTDVIVNTTSSSMNLNIGGMSAALSKKAGPALQAAVNKKKASPVNGIIDTETAGCNLSCKRVYHVSLDELVKMKKLVMDCLKLADKSKLQSISLPALGTGILGHPPQKVAAVMLGAAIQFSKDNPTSTLQLIQFVLLPSNKKVVTAFQDEIQNSLLRKNAELDDRENIFCTKESKRVSLVMGQIEDQSTDVIVNTTSPTMNLNIGNVSSALSRKAGPALQTAVNRKKGVFVNTGDIVDTETTLCNLSCKRVYHVSLDMTSSDASLVKLKKVAMDCLKLADKSKLQSISLPALGTGILGYPAQKVAAVMLGAAIQFSKDNPTSTLQLIQFVLLPSNKKVVTAFKKELKNPSDSQQTEDDLYISDLDDQDTFMTDLLGGGLMDDEFGDENVETQQNQDLMLKYPENWGPMEGKQHQFITVDEKSKEYASVKKNVMTGLPSVTRIISIKRIQYLRLYHAYMVMKKSIESKSTGDKYEHILFHGTDNDAIKNINHGGFNRVFQGKNATLYGKGTYFAKDSGFSHAYANPDENGHRFMYQARVLTGAYCVGSPEMKEPPLKIKNGTERFDSVVNSVTSPSIFVVFHDDQAYPEYLIEYL